jgi:glycosyltransferase involved in cell wall biosynthesis
MKVLVLTKTISPDSGGGRYSHAVLEEYKKMGISFTVVTETGGELLPLSSIGLFIKNILKVRNYAKGHDIVHAFDGWPFAIYAHCAVLGTRKPLVVNAVGTYAVAALKRPVKGFFLKMAYRRAKKIFAISEFVKRRLQMYLNVPVDVVYLGTTWMKTPETSDLEKTRAKYGIQNQTPVLLTVGALKDRKGQFETAEAVKILKEKYPNILYLIVGSTRGTEAYTEKIRKYVWENGLEQNVQIISDAKSDAELASIYTLSTIFLLNSKFDEKSEHSEGFGLVLLEAAQFGKPVIGSVGSGIPEAMEDGFNGVLVQKVEPGQIVEAVEKVLSRYNELAMNSKKVAERFSWKKTAEAYSSAYKK